MGFYVRDYYCGNGTFTLHTTILSPGCPAPTDPTDTTIILQSAKLSLVARAVREGGGEAGYPNPDDDGHVPTWLSPVVRPVGDVLTEADLPALRQQLHAATKMVDAALAGLQATPEQIRGLSEAIATTEKG